MSAPELLLHVGLNKTGTSALQRFFARARERLAAAGVLYPLAGMRGEAHYDLSAALGFSLDGRLPDPERLRRYGEALWREVEAAGPRKVVISSEMFVLPGEIERVRAFFGGFEVRVVIYLRRHDEWWISAYNQSVRAVSRPGWKPGFGNYLAFQRRNPNRWYLDYARFVDAWASVFGHGAIVVRPYEPCQNRPSLVHDFLAATGCPVEPAGGEAAGRVNRSVSLKGLQLIDLWQRTIDDDALRARLIAHVLETGGGGRPFDLPLDVKRALVAAHRRDYEYIARRYLGRADGRLFFEPVESTTDEDLEQAHPLSAEEAVSATVAALRHVLQPIREGKTADA